MNVSLTPELERYIDEKVAGGHYQTASEVVREGLRLLVERDRLRSLQLEALKNDIAAGVAESDRGESRPLDTDAIKRKGRAALARHGRDNSCRE